MKLDKINSMDNFKKLNSLLGWIVFAIATTVYFLTLEPSASWWDCGEYIATTYKLQVGHPPGAPFFQLLGRFFSLFAFGDVSKVALMVNVMSALSSSFTILFLFWTITMLAQKIMVKSDNRIPTKGQGWAILGAGAVGALAYTFSDSFWFSAVEGEVYAMSSLATAVVFWAILKWEQVADKRSGFRWLLLIAYVIGLSVGVHLLNLLAIPAIVYVYYYKKYTYSNKGFIIAGLVSLFLLAFIMYIIIPWIVRLAGSFELFFVNSLGMPFNSGTIVYFILLFGAIIFGILYSIKKKKVVLNTVLLAFTFILIGYSSFVILVIRANTNTPINENDPKDAPSLLAYLNREQYGSWPLFHGQYYNAPVVDLEDGNPAYIKDDDSGKYIVKDDRKSVVPVYDERFTTIFPRMYSGSKPQHKEMYKHYGDIKGVPIKVPDGKGGNQTIYKPTFGENLTFFLRYQVNWMYLRYFMWNFAGRQNDIESQGEINHGNWISGINFIDSWRLGDQSNLPSTMKNPATAKFYFLPLILGLVGFFFQLSKSKKDTWVVALLFLMTGLAIIIYLNQTPYQPRERDYAYAGSFYAFAIWIGLGVLSLFSFAEKYIKNKPLAAGVVTFISLVFVPGIMAQQGWEGHNRSGKYAAADVAKRYLDSCEPNAILFTNGDNDTFPLWYVQEVENYRTDVRVVNYMLSSGDWYVEQMLRKVYESDKLPLSIDKKFYTTKANHTPIFERFDGGADVDDAVSFIANDTKQTQIQLMDGTWTNYLPVKNLRLPIDKDAVLKSGTVKLEDKDKIVDTIEWRVTANSLYRNDLMLLDLIASNNWERPIYFANPSSHNHVMNNIDKYCHQEGVVFRFKPFEAPHYYPKYGGVDTDKSYDVLLSDDIRWGRLNENDVVVDRESARNSGMVRLSYARLAEGLLAEKKYDSVVATLDMVNKFFPNEKFPYNNYTYSWPDLYYKAGATEKGDEMARDIFNNYDEELKYYSSLNNKFLAQYQDDIQIALFMLQKQMQITSQHGRTDLSKEIEKSFYNYIDILGYR